MTPRRALSRAPLSLINHESTTSWRAHAVMLAPLVSSSISDILYFHQPAAAAGRSGTLMDSFFTAQLAGANVSQSARDV